MRAFWLPRIVPMLGLMAIASAQEPAASRTEVAETPAAQSVEAVAPFKVEVTGKGRPMILIPGLSCGGNVWNGTVEHFKDRYECHVVTLSGFAGEPWIGEPFLPRVRDGLIKYIHDKNLEKPVLIGHSMGATLSLWVAATSPDDVGAVVALDGVPYLGALMIPGATVETMKPQADAMKAMMSRQTQDMFIAQNTMTLTTMMNKPDDVKFVAEQSNKSEPKAVSQAVYELLTTDLREDMASIKAPVLLIGAVYSVASAEQRATFESGYRDQVSKVPNHLVIFAPKSKHFVQLDAPEFFYASVEEFLEHGKVTAAETSEMK